jgi:hypothetical protein
MISRRVFVRGMVGLGVTIATANQLADVAHAAPRAVPAVVDDVYGGEAVGSGDGDGNSDDTDPDLNAGGGQVQELANVMQLPNTGVGREESSSRRMKLLGVGSALAAAAALGFQRSKGVGAGLEAWPGWESGDEDPAEHRAIAPKSN